MKKLISMLVVLSLVLQFGLVVNGADGDIIYELNQDDMGTGELRENAYNPSLKGTVRIEEEADGSCYIAVRDKDDAQNVGFAPTLNFDGVKTVSFDYRTVVGAKHPAMLYLGGAVSITLTGTPTYYNQKSYQTTGTLYPGEWMNITLVTDSASKTFDLYTDGYCIAENIGTRDDKQIKGDMQLKFMGHTKTDSEFDFKNFKVYDGEVVPPLSEAIKETLVNPDRTLVDYANARERLSGALGNAVAMTVGNSMARVNNNYVAIDPDNAYVAPFITPDGYTLIPTRFTTETIGCTVEVLSATSFRFSKGGTVMEINMGDKNAIINGQPVEMPTTPVIKNDRLFIPLRFAAETYGKNVFWDDRGLIIISDGEVVKAGQEDIIKPLINEIRSYTTIFGNKKYSDVNYSARSYRIDGFDGGQWGALDAAKRFMATVNRWTYVTSGDQIKAFQDQGLLQQGTTNANANGDYGKLGTEKNATTYFLGGTPYTRADGLNGTTWGCVNNPYWMENTKQRVEAGIDNGLFLWQYDDWMLHRNYRLGGCHCDWCNDAFGEYLRNEATPEELESIKAQGITDVSNFDYVKWLASQGITDQNLYTKVTDSPIDKVRQSFYTKKIREYHKEMLAHMREYSGSDIFYSINLDNTLTRGVTEERSWLVDQVDGVMGETGGGNTTAGGVYATMLLTRGLNIENVLSPLPKDETAKNLMYSAIPMTYATGQFMLVPWDDWLYGSTRYYANLEELEGTFEFPREYPFLFDNYEIPEAIGYVFDLDEKSNIQPAATQLLEKGIPARALIRRSSEYAPYTFTAEKTKGLQAIVASGKLPNLTAEEKAVLDNSGVTFVKADDTETISWLENSYWTVRDNDKDVYTILRTNQLYDNAPVVVHAVNYDATEAHKNVEVELNNLWLPEGDTFKINVYKPGENYETITAKRGDGVTKVTIDSVDRWTVLEICGANTVRREVKFDLGEGYNGIGMGTRISNDKAYGNLDNFTIVTYSEGLYSTTFNDTTGTQDEAAFVYSRLGNSKLKSATINAGFGEADGAYGVMVRDGIYSNARFAALMYDEVNGLRLAKRNITNKAVVYTDLGNTKPAYMKLQRDTGAYVAYISDDGKSFTEVGRIEISFDAPVGGVFAASPDGSRAECEVKDFWVSEGNFPAEDFEFFRIKYGDGTIDQTDKGAPLELQLETENHTGLGINDVSMTFKSSNEDVLKVTELGTLTPVSEGTATISATAKMGLKTISASTNIRVKPVNPVMFEEDFEENKWPEYLVHSTAGKPGVKNGAVQAVTDTTGEECDMKFTFDQKNMPTVFEFDFRAKFGKASPTTGARVIYANGNSMSLTADPNGFNWFFASSQDHIMPIEENRWYHIKIEASYDKGWANVYIDGVKIVDKGQPRSSISPDGNIQIGGWRLGDDSCYEWDNFKIYFVEGFEE